MSDLKDLDETELGLRHSAKAHELSTIKTVIVEVDKRAGEAFVRGRDEVANALRCLSQHLSFERDKASKRLDEFIKEDGRRRQEMRRFVK